MTKIIWVDLDEVLAEFIDYALEHHNYKINWIEVTRESIRDYYLHRMVEFDLDATAAIDWFRKALYADEKLEVKPLEWAMEWLEKLKAKWYSLKIITARPWDLFWEYTSKWINKHYPNMFEAIIYANHFTWEDKTKSELCKEHWIFHMIEDNPDYALDLANNWIVCYLLEKPWNKLREETHENLIKVKSWEDINFK